MKNLLKDKVFLAGAIIVVLALGKLVHNNVDLQLGYPEKNVSQITNPQAPPFRQQLFAKADSRRPSHENSLLPLKKSRPKSKNEWVVGSSTKADTPDLDSVFSNMAEGDLITLEPEEIKCDLSKIPRKMIVRIIGTPGSVLELSNGIVNDFKTFSIENTTVKVNVDNGKTMFIGEDQSIVIFNNVTIYGNDQTFFLSENSSIHFLKSKLENLRLSLSGRVKVFFQDSDLANEYKDFAALNDVVEVNLKDSRINKIGSYGFYFLSQRSSVKLENVTVLDFEGRLFGGTHSENQVVRINVK